MLLLVTEELRPSEDFLWRSFGLVLSLWLWKKEYPDEQAHAVSRLLSHKFRWNSWGPLFVFYVPFSLKALLLSPKPLPSSACGGDGVCPGTESWSGPLSVQRSYLCFHLSVTSSAAKNKKKTRSYLNKNDTFNPLENQSYQFIIMVLAVATIFHIVSFRALLLTQQTSHLSAEQGHRVRRGERGSKSKMLQANAKNGTWKTSVTGNIQLRS